MVEELLIGKVRQYDFLYDKKHKDYRDSAVRQTAWEEIGKELQMPGSAAKEMWDKLRRCFTNARNRCLDVKRSDPGAKKKVVWKYEKQMSFLLPFLETRKTHSSLNDTQNEWHTPQIADFETKPFGQISSESEGNDEAAFEEHLFQPQETKAVRISESVEILQRKKRKEPSQNSPSAQNHSPVVILEETAPLRKRKCEEKSQFQGLKSLEGFDEMDLFFLSMSRMTKKLPKLEQARIKLELSNLVLSAEIQDQQANSSSSYRQHDYRFAGTQSPTTMGSSSE